MYIELPATHLTRRYWLEAEAAARRLSRWI